MTTQESINNSYEKLKNRLRPAIPVARSRKPAQSNGENQNQHHERYEQVHSALIYVDAEKADVRYINFNGRLQRHERVAYHLRQRQTSFIL